MPVANESQISRTQTGTADERWRLRLSAALLVAGFVALTVAAAFHPNGIDNNNHPAVFVQYAQSASWTAVHLALFIATAVIIAGLVVLFYALYLPEGIPAMAASIGIISAGVGLALSAMRYAADGVVLKRAVDAWVSAPDAEKAARFASAEIARWLEEAITSYQGLVLGFTLILLGVLIVWTARAPRPVGYLLALGGAGYLAAGWIVGAAGFAPEGAIPTYIAQFSPLIAGIWLLISAWRMPEPAEVSHESDSPDPQRSR